MGHKVALLSTSLLDHFLINKAADANIQLDIISFISVSVVRDEKLANEIALLSEQPLTIVFTSANAVQAVCNNIDCKPANWRIYCIGNATKDRVLEYFGEECIQGTEGDAASLAKHILRKNIKEIVFFCGDKRIDALPSILKQSGITVKEIVVYKTEETPQQMLKGYDGVLFFSPSGVNSFFRLNEVPAYTVLFAIGNTTATTIKERTGNRVIISDNPTKEEVVTNAIKYFHKKAIAALE